MQQGTKHTDRGVTPKTKRRTSKKRGIYAKRCHKQKFGTSKLEEKFATEFLDKLGVKYVYQYEAKSIGRFYDFAIPDSRILIEVDGDWYHSRDIMYEDMNPMQKHNKAVDKVKDTWAALNGYLLIRIWEYDINHDPEKVFDTLRTHLGIQNEKKKIQENHNKRH